MSVSVRGGRVAAAMVVTAGLAAGCLPHAATAQAREVGSLYAWFVAAAAIVGGIVWVPLTWAVVRYRAGRRRASDAAATDPVGAETDPVVAEEPPQVRGHVGLELLWTAGPAVTIAGLFALTLIALTPIEARAPVPAVEVEVVGHRWGWTFTYPREGIRIVGDGSPGPELVLPTDESIALTLTSADVIHSFYVPQFLMKRDATPGRVTRFDVIIEAPGVYGGQCAEYCGILHDQMPLTVRAVTPDEYRAWLAMQAAASP